MRLNQNIRTKILIWNCEFRYLKSTKSTQTHACFIPTRRPSIFAILGFTINQAVCLKLSFQLLSSLMSIGSNKTSISVLCAVNTVVSLRFWHLIEDLSELDFSLLIYLELTSYTLISAVNDYAEFAFRELSKGDSGSHLNMIHVWA